MGKSRMVAMVNIFFITFMKCYAYRSILGNLLASLLIKISAHISFFFINISLERSYLAKTVKKTLE